MSGLLPIQLNYGSDDSEMEEGELEDDSVILKRMITENPQIQDMIKSQSLKDLIKIVLDKHSKQFNADNKSNIKRNCFGLQSWEQSFLKDYILQSKQFKNLIECLLGILAKFDEDQK